MPVELPSRKCTKFTSNLIRRRIRAWYEFKERIYRSSFCTVAQCFMHAFLSFLLLLPALHKRTFFWSSISCTRSIVVDGGPVALAKSVTLSFQKGFYNQLKNYVAFCLFLFASCGRHGKARTSILRAVDRSAWNRQGETTFFPVYHQVSRVFPAARRKGDKCTFRSLRGWRCVGKFLKLQITFIIWVASGIKIGKLCCKLIRKRKKQNWW